MRMDKFGAEYHRLRRQRQRLREIRQQNQELKQSNREMLEWFTKMRKAAGGQNDTMGEAVERVAGLERELAAVRACLSGLKITPEQIHKALDDLGPTRDRAEAYVKVATETLIRIMQVLAGRRGEE